MKENVNKEVTNLLQQLIVEEFDGDSKIINQHIDQIISSLIELLKDEDHMRTLGSVPKVGGKFELKLFSFFSKRRILKNI